MRPAAVLFGRLTLRPLLREPLRALLTIVAVALGVGVTLAIELAGDAAAGSFRSSVETLSGGSDFLITAPAGIPESLLGELTSLPIPLTFAGRIEDFASIGGRGETIPLLGLDLIGGIAASTGKSDTGGEGGTPLFQARGRPLWASAGLHLHSGASVALLVNDKLTEFTVAGTIPGDGSLLVTDIGIAQQLAGKSGRLDAIEVRLPKGGAPAGWREQITKVLPAGVTIAPQGARTESNRKMLGAFRANLRVLSYIALVVGAFLIYNAIAISVVRRRVEIGVVRALGATKGWILAAFLAEAGSLALAGSALGLIIGRVFAAAAVRLIGETVRALYVSSEAGAIQMTPATIAAGLAMGMLISLVAALAPALEAARVEPTAAMARGREEGETRMRLPLRMAAAVALFAAAATVARWPAVNGKPLFAYAAVVLAIAGTAALIPGVLLLVARFGSSAAGCVAGVEGTLALRSLAASLRRSSVLIAALATAVAMTASVGIMVGSFRETVAVWMSNQLKADFYLRPAGRAAADQYPTMSAEVATRIARLPGVAAVDRFRAYPITYEGLHATFAGSESNAASASQRFLAGADPAAIFRKLPTGDYALVSEPFANKHHVAAGNTVRLVLAGAERAFRVLGVYYDYSTESGYIVVDRKTLLRYLPDRALSSVAVYLSPGAQRDVVRREIDGVLNGHAVLVFSNGALRKAALATFDRTFRITYGLEGIAVVVAVMGVAGALLAMILDRRREFAILRFLGASRGQLRGIILCEAGLLGLLANGIGLVLGILLSLVLIFVINKQSFGWTLQFYLPAGALAAVITVIFAATVLAGLYPARRALRINSLETMHEE